MGPADPSSWKRILTSVMSDTRPRTFVVDDELDIAKLMVVILQMNLFDAQPFCDPLEALEAAKAEAPEYLISDVVMPQMNGLELAAAVQEVVPGCKVLLFSGQVGAQELIERSAAEGRRFDLVQKPIQPAELVAALRAL